MFIQSSIDRKNSRRREIYFTDHHNCQLESLESISIKNALNKMKYLVVSISRFSYFHQQYKQATRSWQDQNILFF